MIVVIYNNQFCFQRTTRETTFHINWCHPLTPPFFCINRDKSGPLRASNPVFPIHFDAHPTCVYVLSVYVLRHDKHQRLLDSKTSTTIRFKIRFKVVSCIFSKYGHPGKRNWNFFFFFFWPKTLARLVLFNEVLTLDSLLISFTTILETFRFEDDSNNVDEI